MACDPCDNVISCCPEENYPYVNCSFTLEAGPDQIISSLSTSMAATVTQIGECDYVLGWEKVSGPGTIVFDPETTVDSEATFSEEGTYVIRATLTDGTVCLSDKLGVVVGTSGVVCNPGTWEESLSLSGATAEFEDDIDAAPSTYWVLRFRFVVPITESTYVTVFGWWNGTTMVTYISDADEPGTIYVSVASNAVAVKLTSDDSTVTTFTLVHADKTVEIAPVSDGSSATARADGYCETPSVPDEGDIVFS